MAPAMPAAPTFATLAGDAALDLVELPDVDVDVELTRLDGACQPTSKNKKSPLLTRQ